MSDEYRIRQATTPEDLTAGREVVLHAMEVDLGYGYQPQWHWDLDHPLEIYADNPRNAMFVLTNAENAVVSTAAIRVGGPKNPPHPQWLVEKYTDRLSVAQLIRVATLPEYRQRGLARRLVDRCQKFVRDDGDYRVIYAHTNTLVEAAERFWRSLPIIETYDARGAESDDERFQTLHFELPMDKSVLHDKDVVTA